MSSTPPQGQHPSVGNFFNSHGAAAELQSILDRVKDERLRLLRLLKDCEARFGTGGIIPPAEDIARLTGKVRAIDEAVRQRYNQLRKDETTLDNRTGQLTQLRQGVQELADQFNEQINRARSFKPELDAARRQVVDSLELTLHDALSQIDEAGKAAAGHLNEFRKAQAEAKDQLSETHGEVKKTFTKIDDHLAAAAGQARDEASKLIDPIFGQLESHATQCGERVQQIIAAADRTMSDKLEQFPGQAEQALLPARDTLNNVIEDARDQTASLNREIQNLDARVLELTDRANDLLQQRLDELPRRADALLDAYITQRLDKHKEALAEHESAIRDRLVELDGHLATRFESEQAELIKREQAMDKKIHEMFLHKQAELTRTLDQHGQILADRLIGRHDQRIEASVKALESKREMMLQGIEESGQALSELWQQKAEAFTEDARVRADDLVVELTGRVDRALNEAEDRAESTGQQINDRLVASLDQSYAEAIDSTKRVESKAQEVSAKADEKVRYVADAIERTMREQVVKAMGRAEALTDPFKARLQEVIANHRKQVGELAQIVEAKITDRTKAQWESFRSETYAAFQEQKKELEQLVDQTIEGTQGKMRQRVRDLCTASQSMVEMIEQQLARRLKDIEPQTHQALEVIESQLTQRLDQLRDNSQAMVQVLEDQLGKRFADLQPQAVAAARDAERELHEHMTRVRQEVENVVSPLRRQVIEELGEIADVGKSVRGAIRREAQDEAGTMEPSVVDASKLTTPLQEMATRIGKKATKLVSARDEAQKAANQPDDQDPDADRKAA